MHGINSSKLHSINAVVIFITILAPNFDTIENQLKQNFFFFVNSKEN